ncbi:LPXTG cell wall anchor domain-containing protein [Desertimonas flava]|uniref:LPXTG cell wall anchor domain-containing protein n=1 Tax=Desertimonas flava TaxID=2064846 RepID=UPI0023F5603C|nr:LPXTG cell wall anchor domain-containing protein [Desertimonas flava]
MGETIEYVYCGENTSDVPLEVIRVDDDRFGTLILPADRTVVEPGGEICNTELDLPVSLVVEAADEGTTIINRAIATVQTVDGRQFQLSDSAEVEVPAPMPPTGASGTPYILMIAGSVLAAGSALLVISRRRPDPTS